MKYPDETLLEYRYGEAGSADDAFNRVQHLQSGSAMGVDYSFLGLDRTVICGYSCEPSVELTYYTPGGTGEAGDQYTGLDRFGRVIDQRWRKTSDNSDKERVKYGFDRASNRVWRQNTVAATGQDEFYTYDGLYQIKSLQRGTLNSTKTGITGTPSWEENWNYDPMGNWHGTSTGYLTKVTGTTTLNQNRTHNVANEITDISESTGTAWPTPVQDAVGNMTSIPQPLSLGNSFSVKWDAWNRPVEITTSSGGFVARYAYDGANRRMTKLTGAEFRHFYYSDQWQVLEERLDGTANADRRFFWGMRYIDDLICRDRGSERLYALHDYFSVTSVVDVNGDVEERYGYDGFGGILYMTPSFGSRAASDYSWETLYAAYCYDTETGLYQVRFRSLHSKLGRWLTRDPIAEHGGVNLYAYCANQAPNAVDYLGLLNPVVDAILGCSKDILWEIAKRKIEQKGVKYWLCGEIRRHVADDDVNWCTGYTFDSLDLVEENDIKKITAGCLLSFLKGKKLDKYTEFLPPEIKKIIDKGTDYALEKLLDVFKETKRTAQITAICKCGKMTGTAVAVLSTDFGGLQINFGTQNLTPTRITCTFQDLNSLCDEC